MPALAYKFAYKRVSVVEEVVDEWKVECQEYEQTEPQRAEPRCAHDVEDLLAETAALVHPIKRVVANVGDSANPDAGRQAITRAHAIGGLLDKALELFAKVKKVADCARQAGYAVNGTDKFTDSWTELGVMRNSFREGWMLPDENRVKRSLEELAAGEYRVL